MKKILLLIPFLFLLLHCQPVSPNVTTEGVNVLEAQQIVTNNKQHKYQDTTYIPIYSDIYTRTTSEKILLTATLSIRNTSLKDSIFINDIDYYNSAGDLIREYLEGSIFLKPMQSIEYVIAEKDKTGGTGANFIVNWEASRNIKPVFQGVMISTAGQHGISFVTDGYSIRQ